MPYSPDLKAIMLNAVNTTPSAVTTNSVYVSAHTASPGTTGANEHANSGGYARVGVNLPAATQGTPSRTAGNQPVITVAAGTYTHLGFWSSGTYGAGTFYGYVDITDEVFAGAGTLTVTSCVFQIND